MREFCGNVYWKFIILCIFVSGSFALRPGIKPKAHLDYISRHGDQDETENCSIEDGCHMLPLWCVDVDSRQQDCQNNGYNLHPSKSRPYGNKVENCLKRFINFMWRDSMVSSEFRAYHVLLKLKCVFFSIFPLRLQASALFHSLRKHAWVGNKHILVSMTELFWVRNTCRNNNCIKFEGGGRLLTL